MKTGANIVTGIIQKLKNERQKLPKLQILINPVTQGLSNKLPSYMEYETKTIISQAGLNTIIFGAWYLGITAKDNEYNELVDDMSNCNPYLYLKDELLINKYKSYLDVSKIPAEYKTGRKYYDDYEKIKDTIYEKSKFISENSKLINLAKTFLNHDISPLLIDREHLIDHPKAYFIICEWDELKDEGILYAERLKEANVEVKVKFYEKGFHGIHATTNKLLGFKLAREIQNELIEYLKLNIESQIMHYEQIGI